MRSLRRIQAFSILVLLAGTLGFPKDADARAMGNWCVLYEAESFAGGTCQPISEEMEVLCFSCTYACPAEDWPEYDYTVTTDCYYAESFGACVNEYPNGASSECDGLYYDPIGPQ